MASSRNNFVPRTMKSLNSDLKTLKERRKHGAEIDGSKTSHKDGTSFMVLL